MRVPDELRSGNHALIQKWQRQEALKKTYRVRPDLISGSFKGEKNE
jgi:tRNA (guanine37-N1)-methyltransferase